MIASLPPQAAYYFLLPRKTLVAIILAQKLQLGILKRKRGLIRTKLRERILIVFLIRFIKNWKDHICLVRADTVMHWIRFMQKNVWKLKIWLGIFRSNLRRLMGKTKKGRPPTRKEILDVIGLIKSENPRFGCDKILGELLMLGLMVSRSRIALYLRRYFPPPEKNRQIQLSWKQLVCGLKTGVCSMDFFTVLDAACRQLTCFFIIDHSRRKVLHFAATYHPSQLWTWSQLQRCFQRHGSPEYLISDNDSIFVHQVSRRLGECGVRHIRTAYHSPWQNPVAERVIRTFREDVFNRILIFNSRHAETLMEEYLPYYNQNRTHLTLNKDSPEGREIEAKPAPDARIVGVPVLGGLLHHYRWQKVA